MADEQAEAAKSEFGFELEEIQQFIELVETRGLAKLEIEEQDRRLVIRGARADNYAGAAVSAPPDAATSSTSTKPSRKPAVHVKRIVLESPMVGVFYRSTTPESPPLVDVGDRVEIGQSIGVIEAMKVFSEIPSDHAGVVLEVVAKNGELVRQGAPLMYLKQD